MQHCHGGTTEGDSSVLKLAAKYPMHLRHKYNEQPKLGTPHGSSKGLGFRVKGTPLDPKP